MNAATRLLLATAFASGFASATTPSDEILAMFRADQEYRADGAAKAAGRTPSFQEELGRRNRIMELVATGRLTTADDFYMSAMILQHTTAVLCNDRVRSNSPENHLLAFYLANRARELGREDATWLMAATMRGYIMHMGWPERFGIVADEVPSGGFRLRLLDPSVTDEERQRVGLVPLAAVLGLK